ncbi:MAG: acetate kinase [Deltaproteobacteria bacterium]|nr:MAG: acetate kinase [Deltaproteobacteria bacterium]
MKILVINTGSSSIKYQLFEMEDESVISSGMAEKIGEEEGTLTHRRYDKEIKLKRRFAEHKDAFQLIKELLVDKGIFAVGHRVVHGGERFSGSVLINDDVIDAIRQNIPIAPLHNPSNLEGIYILKELFPQIPHVAVFDTAFHQSMIEEAFLYALPYSLYEEHRIRRYGFHGTSHAYVSEMAAAYMKRPLDQLNLVTIHLGNGASITAVRGGRSVDTSMGMTPLEGLIMGTRSGDMDPAIPFFLMDHLRMPPDEIYKMLNNESGLKGICGRNDMREILEERENGDPLADLAVRMYCYRIKKYIGAYLAVLGRTDAIVFTAGIGENSSLIRELCLNGLEGLGIRIDKEKNRRNEAEISAEGSSIKVLVIPTDEELRIARETKEIVSRLS